jgi:dihydropteroate synthase
MAYKNRVSPLWMGIINTTPDSFSSDGLDGDVALALNQAVKMLNEGADILDIGGESTRPGAMEVSIEEEYRRVIPVIKVLRKKIKQQFLISVDTRKASIAKAALEAGANWINDVSGLRYDGEMVDVAAKFSCPVVIMHMRTLDPQTMQQGEIVYRDVIQTISDFFEERIKFAVMKGVKRQNIILDPGFGFGKKPDHNLEILERLSEFKNLGAPILIGLSRKGTLGILLQKEENLQALPGPKERLAKALELTALALQNGASIIRTHDIKETKQYIDQIL